MNNGGFMAIRDPPMLYSVYFIGIILRLKEYIKLEYIIAGVIIVLFVLIIFTKGYFKIPTDMAGIVSGFSKEPRIYIGKAGFKIPFLERLDYINLGLVNVDVNTTDSVPTTDYINVNLDAFATVKIRRDAESIKLACVNFLNSSREAIEITARQILEGSLRDIAGSMELKAMVNNRQKLAEKVQESAVEDLGKLGIEVLSFNIQSITDDCDAINNLGIDNIAQIRKQAQIAKAEAERDVQIAQAEADKQANDAKMNSAKQIAEKQNEVAIRKSELKQESDMKRAEADAAYNIKEAEQDKILKARMVEAEIAQREKEVALQEQEAKVQEKSLDATVRRQADAEKYRREKEAEADLFVIKQNAEAELAKKQKEAEALKYSAEKEAEAIRLKGIAEAEAIKAKGLAEAEALQKKAEAMKEYGKAAMAEMAIKILPEVASAIAAPLANIKEMKVYGNGDVSGLAGNTPVVMAQVFDTVKSATGVDLKSIADANSIDAKVNKNVVVKGAIPVETTEKEIKNA